MKQSNLKAIAARAKAVRFVDNALRRNPFFYRKAVRLHATLAQAPLEDRKRWALERLRRIIGVASRTRYGRSIDAGRDIAVWPRLEKSAVRDDPDAFMTRPRWFAAPGNTSGTTGVPLQVYRSFESIAVEQAAFDHLFRSLRGTDPRSERIAILRGDNIKDPSDMTPPYWRVSQGGDLLLLSSNHLRPDTADAYHGILSEFRPAILLAYPTSLEALAGFLVDMGRSIEIPAVLTHAEVQTDRTRDLCQAAFGTVPIDQYGHAERVVFAYSGNGREYYFLPSHSYVELEFAGADPSQGFDSYEVIGTTLWNTAMPLVRYATGDRIRVPRGLGPDELEEIRFGLRPFCGVMGRQADYLVSPDGTRLMGIDHIPYDVCHVIQMQVIQEAVDHVRILVVPTADFSDADRAVILENAQRKIPRSMRIEVCVVDNLERTASGKAPFVIRR